MTKLKSQRPTWREADRGTVFILMCVSPPHPPTPIPLSLSLIIGYWVRKLKREKNNPDKENYSSFNTEEESGMRCQSWFALASKSQHAHLSNTVAQQVIWVAWTHFWWGDLHHENWQCINSGHSQFLRVEGQETYAALAVFGSTARAGDEQNEPECPQHASCGTKMPRWAVITYTIWRNIHIHSKDNTAKSQA